MGATGCGKSPVEDLVCIHTRPRIQPALRGVRPLALLLYFALALVQADDSEVSASTPEELRAALLSGAPRVALTANLVFNSRNWPDPPVTIAKPVIIYSLYRFKLDFCGSEGAAARVLINVSASGSLLLQKVFLRNFLPSAPQNLSGLGPVPAVLSSGGLVTFRLVVFHFLPAVTWVFGPSLAADSFWAGEGIGALSSVYSESALQLQQPALYVLKYLSPTTSAAKYRMDTSYSPMDLNNCYADNGEDTALIYCLYTFADSLRNPTVRRVRVFHDVGLDRLAYSRFNPIAVTQPKSYSPCPGSTPSINLDSLHAAIAVRNTLDFTGLRFKGSLPTNYTAWPPDLPMLLGAFDVDGPGVLLLTNSVVDVPDLASSVDKLLALPGSVSADPTRPKLQPVVDAWPSEQQLELAAATAALPVNASGGSGVIYDAWHPDDGGGRPAVVVRHWVLERNTWQQYAAGALNTYDALNAPSSAAWRFDGVVVRQADNANERALCFSGAMEQGAVLWPRVVRVADEVQLRAAFLRGARYVQVISDIKLSAAVWPAGDAAMVLDEGIIEVRGCHPRYGQRFTLDLSDLVAVVRAKGRLIFQGDLRFTGLGWTALQPTQLLSVAAGVRDVSPMGAFALATNAQGSVECEGILIEVPYDPAGAFRPSDLLAVLHLNHMTPEIRARNASLRGDRGITLGVWCMPQTSPLGLWVFTNTEINWSLAAAGDGGNAAAAAPNRGGGGGVPVHIIAPCVVGGVLLLVAAASGFLLYRRRRARLRLAQDGLMTATATNAQSLSKLAAAAAAVQHQQRRDPKAAAAAAAALSSSMAEALAAAHSSGGDGTDSETAAALAAVLQAANKIITSNANSNASASGCTRTDLSGAAAAPVPAAVGRHRSNKGAGGGGGGGRHETGQGRMEGLDSRGNGPLSDINAAKREMVAGRDLPNNCAGAALDDLVLQAVLGEGSYGRVYRALWRGTAVAVKVIMLPAHMSGRERHERMAVMEAAISSSLSHPNIVQTYTYGAECVEGAKGRRLGLRIAGSHSNSALPEASTGLMECAAPGGGGGGAAGGGGPPGAGGPGSGGRQEGCGGLDRGDDIVGWEIRLVQEYCDLGSLRDKLNARAFFRPAPAVSGPRSGSPLLPATIIDEEDETQDERGGGGKSGGRREAAAAAVEEPPTEATAALPPLLPHSASDVGSGAGSTTEGGGGCDRLSESRPWPDLVVNLAAVLDTAIDVARALAHLHREGIVHADLKPRNVLLKGSTTDPRGFVAKVADFGLSMRLDPDETHVSNAYHGTLAYMAPETLLYGHVSRSSDVYGFGILLYELYTGDTAFRGVPKALIGHAITKENLRPVFPAALTAPFEYQLLACRCWESNPEIRPEFDFILEDLKRMRVRLCAAAPDESSFGPMGHHLSAAGGLGGAFPEVAGGRLWGLPTLSQAPSQQGLQFGAPGAHHPPGPTSHLRGGGACFHTGDRSLSASNSVTMSTLSGLTGLHNAVVRSIAGPTSTTATTATGAAGPPGGGTEEEPAGVAGVVRDFVDGPAARARTAPYPACLDRQATGVEEDGAAGVRSL